MAIISAFTFAYNAIESGMPLVEAIKAVAPYVDEVVAVDCQSTDDTRCMMDTFCQQVIDGPAWEGRDIQHQVFEYHRQCAGDIIIMFEADEVYSDNLLSEILWAIEQGHRDIGIYRIQVEQNFQRVREYPTPVYRVFPKGGGYYHLHPTVCPDNVYVLPPTAGYLWDCSNNFRDNWLQRKHNQAKVWGESRHLMTARHFAEPNEISQIAELDRLQESHWFWTETPLAIPAILKPLVGKTKYEPVY